MWLIFVSKTHFAWDDVQFIISFSRYVQQQLTTSLTKPETFSAYTKTLQSQPHHHLSNKTVQLSLLFCDLITYDTISVIAVENQDGFEKNSWNVVFAINFRPLNKSQNSTKGSKRFI